MLIRFNSKAGSITLFGEAAATLLRMMGQSGAIPGAILAPDIPAAVARLRGALTSGDVAPPEKTKDQTDDKDVEPPVGMRQRAFPLIELLERAAKQNTDVIWEYETRTNL